MKQLSSTHGLGALTSRIDFGRVHADLEFLKTVGHGTRLNVNGQVVLATGISAHAKCLRNLVFIFVLLAHVPSFALGILDQHGTSSAVVNALVKQNPHAVRRADFRCPDFTAMEVPPNTLHAGGFVRCEDWDEYHSLMQAGRTADAEKILVAPLGTAEHLQLEKVTRENLNRKLQETNPEIEDTLTDEKENQDEEH